MRTKLLKEFSELKPGIILKSNYFRTESCTLVLSIYNQELSYIRILIDGKIYFYRLINEIIRFYTFLIILNDDQ